MNGAVSVSNCEQQEALSHEKALSLMQKTLDFIADYEGEIPGCARIECGNYLEHSLHDAKEMAREMREVLRTWTPEQMTYRESELV